MLQKVSTVCWLRQKDVRRDPRSSDFEGTLGCLSMEVVTLFSSVGSAVMKDNSTGMLLEKISKLLWLSNAVHVLVCLWMHKYCTAQEVVFCPGLKLGLYLHTGVTRVAGNLEEERKP